MKTVIRLRKPRWIMISILLIALSGLLSGQVFAQDQEGWEYFPQTGHWVTGAFLEKYYSVPNPEIVFGDPITDAYQDEISGLMIQYFQKARFELHPEEIPDLRVKLSHLGSFLYRKGQTLPVVFNPSACRFFPQIEGGFYVCYDFYEFFEANGGVAQFGYPISNFEVHDGWIAQYFQRARLEWHPEKILGQWVTVSDVGTQYFHEHNENHLRLNPNNEFNIPPQNIIDIKVRAFVGVPIMGFLETQTLYVIVQDQANNPVENAEVRFTVTSPGLDEQSYQMSPTNERGVSVLQFPVRKSTPGIVEIQVTSLFQSFVKHTKTSFHVWW
jgi:hypothetical protein